MFGASFSSGETVAVRPCFHNEMPQSMALLSTKLASYSSTLFMYFNAIAQTLHFWLTDKLPLASSNV